MLALFVTQAPQRQAEMAAALAKDSPEEARRALHSLVNIAGAIRAYGLAELAKVVGECLKSGEVDRAKDIAQELAAEAECVLRQVEAMRKALEVGPRVLWDSRLST
jgi:HPt (histidine-containing phosphotransfer) domain-containing protein